MQKSATEHLIEIYVAQSDDRYIKCPLFPCLLGFFVVVFRQTVQGKYNLSGPVPAQNSIKSGEHHGHLQGSANGDNSCVVTK